MQEPQSLLVYRCRDYRVSTEGSNLLYTVCAISLAENCDDSTQKVTLSPKIYILASYISFVWSSKSRLQTNKDSHPTLPVLSMLTEMSSNSFCWKATSFRPCQKGPVRLEQRAGGMFYMFAVFDHKKSTCAGCLFGLSRYQILTWSEVRSCSGFAKV